MNIHVDNMYITHLTTDCPYIKPILSSVELLVVVLISATLLPNYE